VLGRHTPNLSRVNPAPLGKSDEDGAWRRRWQGPVATPPPVATGPVATGRRAAQSSRFIYSSQLTLRRRDPHIDEIVCRVKSCSVNTVDVVAIPNQIAVSDCLMLAPCRDDVDPAFEWQDFDHFSRRLE